MEEKRSKVVSIGNYQLTGITLGKGNYSVVKEGFHINTKKKFAIKVINIETDVYIKRFYKREAYLLSQLNHENIIRMFEVLESPKRYILILELVPENLCDFVRHQRRGKLDESTARILFRQIISAVIHIHEKGIIHRDIKLENILIDSRKNKIKLTDFGLSSEWDQKNLLVTICGSPEYSSPELHGGKPYGNEIDVWALGVVLFAMVVGRLPFDVSNKKPVNNKERRELFLDETKRGIKTVKHQSYLSSTSHSFRDLLSKLLNPDQQRRIQMKEVEKHDWIVFEKIDIGRMNNSHSHSSRSQIKTPCSTNTTMRPGTAKVTRDVVAKNTQRPITQAEKFQSLRSNRKYIDNVK